MSDRSVLACYAHPDDEQGVTGLLRICLDRGYRVGIVCATRGEVGEIADPSLATPETLGEVREQELRRAAAKIGVKDIYFLDYRDSGMKGTPPNEDPRAFINANPDQVVGRLVKIFRAFKPTILVTFDATGGYGHPDHLAIHDWTTRAFHAAGDAGQFPEAGAPFTPSRLFYSSFPRSMIKQFAGYLEQAGIPSPFPGVALDQMGMPDEMITHTVDVMQYAALKRESLEEHRTQMNPNSPMAKLPEELWNAVRGYERYHLAAGVPMPPDGNQGDLFDGLG